MESTASATATVVVVSETKYQKLASEYAKLRAQASVLKKAVLDEQAKNAHLRDQLRQRETSLRRSEQEVDSLGFRNKQLEHRVAALQEEIATREGRGRNETKHLKRSVFIGGGGKSADAAPLHGSAGTLASGNGNSDLAQDALIFEELQKKIMENAQLTSLIDDKERDLLLHAERITNLEHTLQKRVAEQSELEKRLRRDLEILQCRNSELETKLVEAASMFGSEDALSVSGSDHTPLHNTHLPQNHQQTSCSSSTLAATSAQTSEERIAYLEKEISHWRTQYEIAKLNEAFANCTSASHSHSKDTKQTNISVSNALPPVVAAAGGSGDGNCSCSTTAAGISVKPSFAESKSAQCARDSLKEQPSPPTKEQLMYNNFSKKYEDLLMAKYMAESHVNTFKTETEHLQICLENATQELKDKDEQIHSINEALQLLEDDLATTRSNYEEQICVLTEQVINLSEQLAACK